MAKCMARREAVAQAGRRRARPRSRKNANQERIQASAPGSKQGLRGAKAGEGAGGEC